VVLEENAGLAVNPGDPADLASAIRRLADDRTLAVAMGAAGRDAIEKRYNRNKYSQQFNLLLEDMVR